MTDNNALAIMKKDVVDVVENRVQEFISRGELDLPDDYSVHNAMKSAWLILQNTQTRDKAPVLQACTKESIANSLLDMAMQGLNPAKKQGSFIAYGKQLTFMRTYFGSMALAKRVDKTIEDIVVEVVYEGDTFKYKINRGKKEIVEHEQSIENVDGKKIIAAYCMIIDKNDEVKKTEIMTIDEIKQAWKQSPMHPVDEKGNIKVGSTHDKFTADMCLKTVINKTCKPIINSSNDNHLFRRAANRSVEVMMEEEIAEKANREIIDIEPVAGELLEPEDVPELLAQEQIEAAAIAAEELESTGTDGPEF